MRYGIAVFLFIAITATLEPTEAYAYREDESETQVEADIERGENKFVGKLAEAERNLVHDTKAAMKAEERRDLGILRGQGAGKEASNLPRQGDDSIAEIEREVDALTTPTYR